LLRGELMTEINKISNSMQETTYHKIKSLSNINSQIIHKYTRHHKILPLTKVNLPTKLHKLTKHHPCKTTMVRLYILVRQSKMMI